MDKKAEIIEILLEASRLLNGRGWSKHAMARDVHGNMCGPSSNEASCYCLSGALVKAWRTVDPEHEDFYFKYFEKNFSAVLEEIYKYPFTMTRWNDRKVTQKEDVIQLIQRVATSILGDEHEIDPTEYESVSEALLLPQIDRGVEQNSTS